MPTAWDLTSTSSGPICGCSISVTTASCGALEDQCLHRSPSCRWSLCISRDQHLHVLRRARAQPLEARLAPRPCGSRPVTTRSTGRPPGGDLRRDARPVVDAVAPAPDDLQVVQRPEHGVDFAAAHMQPDLHHGSRRLTASAQVLKASPNPGALDRDVDAQAVRPLTQLGRHVRGRRIEDLAEVEAPGALAPRLVRLGHVDGSRARPPRRRARRTPRSVRRRR